MLKHDAIYKENILAQQAEIFSTVTKNYSFQQAAGGGFGLFWQCLSSVIHFKDLFREELQQILSLPLNSEPTCPQLENPEFPFSEQLISVGSGNSE